MSEIKEAMYIVHWPGKEVPACEEHAAKLRNVADVMGFALSATLCMTERKCTNCENEAKKNLHPQAPSISSPAARED